MRRKLLVNSIAVAAFALLLFAIPLGVLAYNLIRADEIAELEHVATSAERTVGQDTLRGNDPAEFPSFDGETRLGLYDAKGRLRAGVGPLTIEPELGSVLSGNVRHVGGAAMVVGVPVIQEEVVLGAIRAEASKSDVTARVARAWALIAGLGIGAILLSAIFAARRAKRVALPLVELEAAALRIGDGDFTSATPRSGIKEIDGVAQALDVTASRLGNALERERSFSADASHQLRTPITALQVTLEGALISGRITAEVLEQALQETERLTNTVDDLLVLARDTHGERLPMEVAKLLDTIEAEWHGPMASVGRALRVRCDTDVPCIYVSGSAIRHVISVLIANGVDHGDGEVTLHARRVPDGVAIDVSDIGPGFRDGGRDAFVRRSGRSATRGIGLALARSLSEAEGGRLVITQAGAGPTVSLLLPERGN